MGFRLTPPQALRRTSGFTLIELLITVAVVGLLAAIALPSYNIYVAKARRADARAQLVQAAQFMQRFYAANDRYDQDRSKVKVLEPGGMPRSLRTSPSDGTAPVYQLNKIITTPDLYDGDFSVSDFTLTMAPISGGVAAADACGMFTLNAIGVRGITGGNGTKTRDECWK